MASSTEPSLADRLVALLDHLGLERAHVASQIPADLAGLVTTHDARVAGVVLCTPVRLDAAPFADVAARTLLISGDSGLSADVTARAVARLPALQRLVLPNYEAFAWTDVVAERTQPVVERMLAHLGAYQADTPRPPAASGTHAGLTYTIEGNGPALLLLPFFLAPSQWEPAMPALARRFTVVTLGGPHLGGVAMLEDRARAPTYQAMFRTVIDLMAPPPGAPILDVGCGAGSLDRQLVRRQLREGRHPNPITAVDANRFLLREAEAMTIAEGFGDIVRFVPGNAEELPFGADEFGAAFSVTVLEECDAERAIAEMKRVVKPGGRIGVVVRAIDLPQWWNLDMPEALRRKVEPPPQSVGRAGVADASLYRRMRAAGLTDMTGFPATITLDDPDGPMWRYREDSALSLMTPDEVRTWQEARAKAIDAGTLLASHCLHCAVATVPY